MSKLQLTITTPLETVYSESVDQITVTTTSGEITILPKHVPLISHLKTGHVMVKNGGNETYFAIDGGLLEVRHDNTVVILSDRSEHTDDIDIERAEEAAKKAAEYMKNPEEAGTDYAKLQAMMAKEENRARLARRGHRK
ncbi:MAG: ATP synthase F1 subunit epsilon [Candidatus Pacebacteria bacterium]|nr:ATP synthase F1 subunit epsilon [Candidatus Paceibacterota bacterium]